MPLNLTKVYPDLLEIDHLNERIRDNSLKAIFERDVTNNESFTFNGKQIRPTKIDGVLNLDRVFRHLITEQVDVQEDGVLFSRRIFERDRSVRLHWLRQHTEINVEGLVCFSVNERDIRKRKDVITTYILNPKKKYVVVLEPQKSGQDYYLLTAYHLNKKYGLKQMKKKLKKKLPELH